jgi:hypothetical protein
MAEQKSDSQIAAMHAEAVRLAHHALNKHSARLHDDTEVHGLANALIAGGHVQPGGIGKPGSVDRAGVDDKQDGLLEDNYGGGQGGNF